MNIDIKRLYDARFNRLERIRKKQLWKILCERFLQQFVSEQDAVLDVGAGQCEFINHIRSQKRIALDIRRDLKDYADDGVIVKISSIKHLTRKFSPRSMDVIFMSNLLEHLNSKEDVFRLLLEAYSLLKPGGRLLIMQPDIRLVGHAYWDFFDHKVPITFASLWEVLRSIGFVISYYRYPFLPYSTKVAHLPLWPPLLVVYLAFRPIQILVGKQFFLCAVKR